MAWIKTNYANLIAICLAVLLAGSATWMSVPVYPESSSVAVNGPSKAILDEAATATEANRLAQQANVIAYRQAVAASIGAFTGILTLLAAVAAAAYAKTAAGESRRSADIAQQALVAGERAWVSVRVSPAGPLQFLPNGGLSLEIGIHIKNIGKTPAINVHTDVDEIHLELNDTAERLKEFCAKKRIVNTSSSRLLLPDQDYIRSWVPGAEGVTGDYPLFPIFIGCVTYQISPDSTLHQTSFALMLIKKGDVGSLRYQQRGSIPQQKLEFIDVSGAFAD